MKLLIVAQVLDTEDSIFSFFHRWVEEIAARCESVHVICLREGTHNLPDNVRVYSLGKERGERSRLAYSLAFIRLVWVLRKRYDTVFVHQNQEYLLIAGWLWKLMHTPAYLWRNHYAGSLLTDISALFCKKVFCTSRYSYTAKYKKTVLMPVGVDYAHFAEEATSTREPRSILFLARIAPSKRPEMFINALGLLRERGISFTASIVGSPKAEDEPYAKDLRARAESLGLQECLRFQEGVSSASTPAIFAEHDIFVNCSPSGMFDKTLFEAAATGCRVIASSDDFHDAAGDEAYAPDAEALAERLADTLAQNDDAATRRRIQLQALAKAESLGTLADQLLLQCSSTV